MCFKKGCTQGGVGDPLPIGFRGVQPLSFTNKTLEFSLLKTIFLICLIEIKILSSEAIFNTLDLLTSFLSF